MTRDCIKIEAPRLTDELALLMAIDIKYKSLMSKAEVRCLNCNNFFIAALIWKDNPLARFIPAVREKLYSVPPLPSEGED